MVPAKDAPAILLIGTDGAAGVALLGAGSVMVSPGRVGARTLPPRVKQDTLFRVIETKLILI
ncbi:hypothetical protein GCM10023321_08000 [Pseudonocardia eucalypti]|uniref:Uncharacterized protein n=1 Tax=Pseudonocardia eucalypti TaxID=648755 RepID=A0ABP9PIX5_9PSEU